MNTTMKQKLFQLRRGAIAPIAPYGSATASVAEDSLACLQR